MNKKSFWEKYREMKKSIPGDLDKFAKAAIESGFLDLDGFNDSYMPVRIVLSAALRESAEQVGPFTPDARKIFMRKVKQLAAVKE